MADYAIHDTTLIAQANIIRKKFGTNDRQDPADYPAKMNLMGALEEKTASGSVVAFSDGADDVPLKSCAVTIAPTLDGVSSVDVVQTKKNLLNDSARGRNGANIFFGHDTGTQTDFSLKLKAGTYTFSVVTADGTVTNLYVRNSDTNTNVFGFPAYNALSKTFTLAEDTNCAVYVYKSGYTDVTDITSAQIEVGTTATAYEPYVTPTTHTATLGRTIYGGSVNVVNGTGTDENGNDFTFTPVPILSRLGDNTMWGDGDLSVIYRSSGTQTLIPPTLISKTITENGTYTASDEGADGYDEVTVNVPTGTTEPFKVLSINGTAGSETFTADKAGTYMFLVCTSAQGTASITSAVTPDLTFYKQSSDNRGLVGAIYTLGVGDTVTMSNTVVSWVYNTKVVIEMNISVSAVIDSTIVNDGTLPTFSPSISGNALFISMAGGRSNDNSYDRTYTDLNSFEFFGKVETGIFLRIRYGSTVPSYQLYGYDGGCALAIALSVNTPSLLMGGFNSSNEPENEVNELENELDELEQEESET